ncbi:MAG: hypothetical protein V1750_05565, partial [Acidobacteriota bacterium]
WVVKEHAAVTAATTIDLDMSQTVATKSTAGTMVLPARTDSPMRKSARGHITATEWQGHGFVWFGATTTTKPSTDGSRVEYTVDWVEPSSAHQPVTQYMLVMPRNMNLYSVVIREGYPPGGELDAVFIDTPEITAAPDPSAGQDLHSEIAWRVYDPDVWMRCFVVRDNAVVWYSLSPPAETSLRLPRGPSTLDEAAFLGDDWLDAQCQAIDWNLSTDWIERGASTDVFPLARL